MIQLIFALHFGLKLISFRNCNTKAVLPTPPGATTAIKLFLTLDTVESKSLNSLSLPNNPVISWSKVEGSVLGIAHWTLLIQSSGGGDKFSSKAEFKACLTSPNHS